MQDSVLSLGRCPQPVHLTVLAILLLFTPHICTICPADMGSIPLELQVLEGRVPKDVPGMMKSWNLM